MRIVVTGALGHIGSYVIRAIPKAVPDAEIVMVDNLSTQRYASLFDVPASARYRFVEADVLKVDLRPIVEGADAVLHLAAITDAAGSFERKAEVEHVNYNATARVVDACAGTGVSLIHLSSTSVYGTQRDTVDEECPPEDLRPQSPYAETKLREEALVRERGASGAFRFVICRLATICGVSPGMRFHTAVNKFCWQAVFGTPLTVWRTALHQKRPYATLDDAVGAFVFVLRRSLFTGRIYNIVTENLTVHDVVEMIRERVPRVEVAFVDSAIMNQLSYDVRGQRLRDAGFEPRGSVRQAVHDTIDLLQRAGGRG